MGLITLTYNTNGEMCAMQNKRGSKVYYVNSVVTECFLTFSK